MLELYEFEKRIGPLRERYNREQAALASLEGHASNAMDVDAASVALTALADTVTTRLADADWSLKRELIKLLIERIEIHRDEVRLVYKVPPNPFALSPDNRGFLQHWLSRQAIAWDASPSVNT